MQTIENTQQMDNLAPGTLISITQIGSATERWRKTDDGNWLNAAAPEGARPLAARYFHGAVSAGRVSAIDPNTPEAEVVDPNSWDIGSWWTNGSHEGSYVYLVTSLDKTGNVHNLMQISQGNCSRSVISEQQMSTSGQWRKYASLDEVPAQLRWFDTEVLAPARDAVNRVASEGLTVALREHASSTDNGALMDLLTEHGIDMSVSTRCDVTGTTRITGDALANLVGGGATVGTRHMDVAWTRQFETRVVRGCICSLDWEEAVVDRASVLNSLPLNREAFEVTLACPVHP